MFKSLLQRFVPSVAAPISKHTNTLPFTQHLQHQDTKAKPDKAKPDNSILDDANDTAVTGVVIQHYYYDDD